MARIDNSRLWRDQLSPSLEEMEMLALETYAHLPEEFRKLTGEIVTTTAKEAYAPIETLVAKPAA